MIQLCQPAFLITGNGLRFTLQWSFKIVQEVEDMILGSAGNNFSSITGYLSFQMYK